MQYGEPGGRITRDRGMVSWGEGATRLFLPLPTNRIVYSGVKRSPEPNLAQPAEASLAMPPKRPHGSAVRPLR